LILVTFGGILGVFT